MDKSPEYHYSGGSPHPPAPNMAPRGDFPAAPSAESWEVYRQHQAQQVPSRHWGPFPPARPPPPSHGSPHVYPPHLPFDPSRPPPGYFATSPGPTPSASPSSNLKPGHSEDPPGFHLPHRDYQSNTDNYHRGHFDQTGSFSNSATPSYQSSFQSNNNNILAHNYSVDHHNQNYPSRAPPDHPDKNSNKSDEDAWQTKQDEQWVSAFLHRRTKTAPPSAKPSPPKHTVSDFREKLYTAVKMLSELSEVCQTLKNNLENESAWTDSYSRAAELKSSLKESLRTLSDPDRVDMVKKKLALMKKKRARMRRKKAEREEEKQEQEARAAEKEAAIDKHQMKKIQEIEEKNRERELKLAADAVLSEVRRKQADAKRMLDILKALEKLRKLRKEAASRKGMFPGKESDEVFEGHLTRLRSLIRKRTAVYGAEEKALRVMLEGEQEEERKRDHEKRQRKEREKLLQRKREIDMMLFGAELPVDHPLQPYQEYYTQAERSLPALVQIRRDWDQFLVPVDHRDGSSIPQGWVLPDPPSDDVWASALEK
ncbi:programmed cell death protein 7 [Ictalurus punctatus]|uniref:Programmed cell death protein 7 n=1 Tax=Ictalurus punctatus TaxID=7998 RepID=A0A2D0RTX3_ICTPU|nr:programmed cell death protein 7 [Ictalurus punctatus]